MASAGGGDRGLAAALLRRQLRDLTNNPVEGFSAGLVDDSDVFQWQVTIIGPQDTLVRRGAGSASRARGRRGHLIRRLTS